MVDVPVVQVQRSTLWQRAVEIPQLQIEQQHVEAPEIPDSESLEITQVRQVASTEMVEKVEMNVAMLTAGIE